MDREKFNALIGLGAFAITCATGVAVLWLLIR